MTHGLGWGSTAFALVVVVAAGWLGIPGMLGAHPIWAMNVVWIGAPIGAVLSLILAGWLRPTPHAVLAGALLGLACFAAYSGKSAFAISFGEDALAGRLWFFGWIATSALSVGLVSALFRLTQGSKFG